MDDAFKLGRGGMLDTDTNKPGLKKCRRFTGQALTQCCLLQKLHFCYWLLHYQKYLSSLSKLKARERTEDT